MTIDDDDSDDDDDDDGDDRSGLTHAACASDGDDDGDDPIGEAMIEVALPMPLTPPTAMTMAMWMIGVASRMNLICFSSDPIGVSFCSFSVELLREAWV